MREHLKKPIELMRRDELIDLALPLDDIACELAALRNHAEYWAMPQCVHKLIARAQEATNAA